MSIASWACADKMVVLVVAELWKNVVENNLVGGFNHLEEYESQWEGLSHILWKITNVPNHQSVTCETIRHRCFIHNIIYIYIYILYMP